MDSLIYCDMLGKDIALKSAMNFRFLRKNGITIRKTADIIIGTFCIERELPLLHNDRDFEPMEKYLGLIAYKNGE
jgi:predicted nucleic acid-binding protein